MGVGVGTQVQVPLLLCKHTLVSETGPILILGFRADLSRLAVSSIPPSPNSGSAGSSEYLPRASCLRLLCVAEGKEVFNKELDV